MATIHAHRGLHEGGLRENSMEALCEAEARGFGIETDLRVTSDGVGVLFHDRVLVGTAVRDMSYDLLCRTAGYTVATLQWLVEGAWDVPVNLEIKDRAAFETLTKMVGDDADAVARDFLISSFDHSIVNDARDAGYECARLYAHAPAKGETLMIKGAERSRTVVLDFNTVTEHVVDTWRSAGYQVMVYGAHTAGELRWLADRGLGMITDHPELARQVTSEASK